MRPWRVKALSWRQTSLLLLDATQAYPEPPFGRFLLSPVSCPILFPSWAGVLWCLRSSSFSFHFNKNRSSKNIRTTNKQKPNAGSWWVPKPNPTCGPTLPGFTAIWAHSRAPEYLDVHGLCLWSCSPGASTARCMDRCVDAANDSRQLDHGYATILQLTEIEIAWNSILSAWLLAFLIPSPLSSPWFCDFCDSESSLGKCLGSWPLGSPFRIVENGVDRLLDEICVDQRKIL